MNLKSEGESAMLKGIRVLAVDDDAMCLDLLSTILVSHGVLCTTVTNGREALEELETNPAIDIMLLDLQMPVMDGFEVLSQCKGNPYLRNIPIIVLASNFEEKLKSLKLGADDFLAKPYEMEELKLRISKLVQSRRTAQSATRAKQEFLAIASHELRTPMHQITGLAELLDDIDLGAEQRELIQLLKHATSSLTDVITDILNFVQLDHGAVNSMMEPFSLRATLQSAIDSRKLSAEERGINLELSIDTDISDALNGPSLYLYKTISILIENAIKFSSGGTVQISFIEKSLGSSSSRFHCTVSDQGLGIPEGFQDKIFEPFAQVDSAKNRTFAGLGLGLAIAKRMVELMGGTIYATNNINTGSSFKFSFQCDVQSI
jgi:signal transduction histidine kinase